jgi:uncharacterized membrane protein
MPIRLAFLAGEGHDATGSGGMAKMTTKPTAFARLAEAIPSKVLRRVFIGSIALNMVVAGSVIGDGLFSGPHRGPRAVEMTLGPIARALAEDDRRLILESLRDNPALQPFGRNDHATDVRAAIEAQSAKVSDAQQVVQEAVLVRLAAMSAEERAEFVERLQDD